MSHVRSTGFILLMCIELVLHTETGHGNGSLYTFVGEVTFYLTVLVFQGGQKGVISLTAFVLIALAEANSKSQVSCDRTGEWGERGRN